MLPNKVFDQTTGLLMAAWKDCRPYEPEKTPVEDSIFTSTNYFRVALGGEGRRAVGRAVEKCSRYLDHYPIKQFDQHLRRFVADAKETATSPAEASILLRGKITDWFRPFDNLPEWEVVMAVTALADGQPPFTVGPCRFFVMDPAEFHRWGQREYSGRYDPPPQTPVLAQQPFDQQIIGNWVAAVRVLAVDSNHANSKARYRLEEVLNVLRYGALQFGLSRNCPRTGLGLATYLDNQSLCMQISPARGFSRIMDGSPGTNVKTCSYSPAWPELVALVGKEATARTGLEATVATALEWVGQAAAAPLAPVRLVSLVTALEVLVMGEHESLGKRFKLSRRVGRIVLAVLPGTDRAEAKADDLYRVRSECLHEGVTQIDDADVKTAYEFVAAVIKAYLTMEPYCKCPDLAAVLALSEPPCELTYEI